MANEIIDNAKERMNSSLNSLQRDLGHIRAGRANASLLGVLWRTNTTKSNGINHNSRSACFDDYTI